MTNTVKLGCKCGQVEGTLEVHKKDSFHVECMCCDCQVFVDHLKNQHVLESYGGTELFQTYPSYVTITKGIENIACMRLTPNGLLRHHTTCCNTPVGNMMAGPKMPFIGIPTAFMKFASDEDKNEILGPVTMRAFGKYANGEPPYDAYDSFPKSYLPRILYFILKGKFLKRYEPSPFFKDGKHNVPTKLAPRAV